MYQPGNNPLEYYENGSDAEEPQANKINIRRYLPIKSQQPHISHENHVSI
jgi:hypothetical protein